MFGALMVACALSAGAQSAAPEPMQLLDRLTGKWVLTGTIGGKQTTHDVEARWVLRREYIEIHEVSRKGMPEYEAIILVSWDAKAGQYACLWMDSTAGGALTSPVTCRAVPAEDAIPLVFTLSATESIHTTFAYRKATDAWRWTIDDEANGKTERFADLVMARKK